MQHINKNGSRVSRTQACGALTALMVLAATFGAVPAEACTYTFVSAGAGAKMWMINKETSKVVAQIPPSGPLQETVSADGAVRYVVNTERNEVSVVNTKTKAVKTCIPVGKGPFGLALSLDGKHLFVLNRQSNNLFVIDTKIDKVVQIDAAPVDNFGMHMSTDGKHIMSMVK